MSQNGAVSEPLLASYRLQPGGYDYNVDQQENDKLVDGAVGTNYKTSDYIESSDGDPNAPQKKLVRNTPLRWLMLAFGCMFLMGSYFCYDNPAPLKSRLTAPPFDFSPTQFNALYSIYSFPNMILPLVGGIAMDKLGVRYVTTTTY